MKKTRFSEAQIVAVLQEGEAGLPVAQILRIYIEACHLQTTAPPPITSV